MLGHDFNLFCFQAAMKAIKEHVVEMCKHEHAHTAIICLLDSADDTVLLNKAILAEIINKSEELIVDDWGRRVLAWIVAPGDRKQFHPQFINELEQGRKESTCKKDTEVRRKEIIDHCAKPLLQKIAELPKTWCLDAKALLVTAQVLRNDTVMENAGEAFKGFAQLVVEEVQADGQLYIENSGVNMSLKKLIQNDKNIQGDDTLGAAIVNCLTDDIVSTILKIVYCWLPNHLWFVSGSILGETEQRLLPPGWHLLKQQAIHTGTT